MCYQQVWCCSGGGVGGESFCPGVVFDGGCARVMVWSRACKLVTVKKAKVVTPFTTINLKET